MLMLLMGAVEAYQARKAQLAGGVIPGTRGRAWMTPEQGYALAGVCLFLGFGMIIRWWQIRRSHRDE